MGGRRRDATIQIYCIYRKIQGPSPPYYFIIAAVKLADPAFLCATKVERATVLKNVL